MSISKTMPGDAPAPVPYEIRLRATPDKDGYVSPLIHSLAWHDSLSSGVVEDLRGETDDPAFWQQLDDLTIHTLLLHGRFRDRVKKKDEGRTLYGSLLERTQSRGLLWSPVLDTAAVQLAPPEGDLTDVLEERAVSLRDWLFEHGSRDDFEKMLGTYRSEIVRGSLVRNPRFLPNDLALFDMAVGFERNWGRRAEDLDEIVSEDLARYLHHTLENDRQGFGGSRSSSTLRAMELLKALQDREEAQWPEPLLESLARSETLLSAVLLADRVPFDRKHREMIASHPPYTYRYDAARVLIRMPDATPEMLEDCLGNRDFLEHALGRDYGAFDENGGRRVSEDMWEALGRRVIESERVDLVELAVGREDIPVHLARKILRQGWGSRRKSVRIALSGNRTLRRVDDLRALLEGSAIVAVHINLVGDAGEYDVSDSLRLVVDKGTEAEVIEALGLLSDAKNANLSSDILATLLSSRSEGIRAQAFSLSEMFRSTEEGSPNLVTEEAGRSRGTR